MENEDSKLLRKNLGEKNWGQVCEVCKGIQSLEESQQYSRCWATKFGYFEGILEELELNDVVVVLENCRIVYQEEKKGK